MIYIEVLAVQWFRQLVHGLSLQWLGFNTRPVHVGFMLYKVAGGQALIFFLVTLSVNRIAFICCRRWKAEQLTVSLKTLSFCLIRI